ncbi:MAG: Lrp/AsnC family transcriptional regulator [Promethearchaeota archaeon]|nr:MAG: Lrp/AsnC family transcriptional regulator [Candidatus Lokiarchaeota archaeon]
MEELNEDSRQSYSDIADVVDRTEATVRRRVQKMLENDIIDKFTIEYEINSQPKVYSTIKIEPDFKNIKKILKQLKHIQEITDIWRLSGDCGILLRIKIHSIEDFNPLIENKISTIEGVKIIETCFITDIIK